MIGALPIIPTVGCSLIPGLSTACGAAGDVTSSILGAGAGDLLSSLAAGVAQGASWLLGQIGSVISSSTTIDLGAPWFRSHYEVMVALAAVVLVPLLLVSVIQSVYHQSPSALVRTALVHLPLALLLGAVAIQLVQLALAATDALSTAVSSTSSGDVGGALAALASSLASQAAGGGPGVPTFVALLGALFVSFGALVLWVELLIRSAAVYVATLFFPLALASLVWPAVSQWCRRLVETLATLVLSKFVIVAVLGLAVGALGASDGSMSSELAGGALLMLAAFAPFTLLRLVPFAEASAAHQLEGVRHRLQRATLVGGRSAASFVLEHGPGAPMPELVAGTGSAVMPEAPGPDGDPPPEAPPSEGGPGEGVTVPMWRGSAGHGPSSLLSEQPSRIGVDGPPPLWGAPVPNLSRRSASRGVHVLERDNLGPVLKWHPGGRPPPADDADER
jgi:hypothetical protein